LPRAGREMKWRIIEYKVSVPKMKRALWMDDGGGLQNLSKVLNVTQLHT
jgi:hypothetical protein